MGSVKYLSVRYSTKLDTTEKPKANLSYLTRGLMWAPSYLLRQDKSTKTFTMKGNACLLCDLPFLQGKSIESVALVAGEPKMECQKICDPLVSGVSATGFIRELKSQSRNYDDMDQHSQMLMRKYARMQIMQKDEGSSWEGMPAGENMDDLYFYRLKNVPLYHNRPITLPFIEQNESVPYQDVYFFDLSKRSENDDNSVQAIHAITFQNTNG